FLVGGFGFFRETGFFCSLWRAQFLFLAAALMDAGFMNLPVGGYLAILGALLAGTATLSPFATAAALRISIQ
ncbi:heme exporter protein CcmB, partial [Escherichia coli]|uniref:heme exporter protein CcmB n=1 Tax=Escherichia coli TaxID=562 RepID=UPI001485AFCF